MQAFFFALVGQSRYVLFVCVLSVGARLLLIQASYVLQGLVIHVIHAPGSAGCWGRPDCGVLSGRALACWVLHGGYGIPFAGVSGQVPAGSGSSPLLRDSPGGLGDGPHVHSWGRVCCWSRRILHLPGGALWISPVRSGVGWAVDTRVSFHWFSWTGLWFSAHPSNAPPSRFIEGGCLGILLPQ